jgi:hypothetical protein
MDEGFIMSFLKKLLFRYSRRINNYFTDAVRVYVLKGEEEARWAALLSARVAGQKQRKMMLNDLSKMASNVRERFPNKLTRKSLSDRLLSLRQDIELENWNLKNVKREKGNLSTPMGEYLSCIDQADPSIFRRRYPELF